MTSPYTRTTWTEDFAWNEIIQEVNELATNPDEGCDPVETLEEVEENHIWNKTDVTEVQDKLKEICPDNEFTELLENQPWTVVIINEIKDALITGWCECQPVPDELFLGQWIVVKEYGERPSPSGPEYNKCGGRIKLNPWWHFTGQDEWVYSSPCYNHTIYDASNSILRSTIYNTYVTARDNVTSWINDRRNELLQQRFVEELATDLISKRNQLEALENQLAACQSGGGDCSSIIAQISEVNSDITEIENLLQETKTKRDNYKSNAENHLAIADAAAIANWEALQGLQHWDPAAFNIIVDHLAGISAEWGIGEYPYDYQRGGWGVRRTWWYAFAPTYPFEAQAIGGHFTPSGLPFSGGNPLIFYSEFFYQLKHRHKCGWWESLTGACVYEEWGEYDDPPAEYKSILGWTNRIGDKLELIFHKTDGTDKAEEYNPDPDQ